MKKNTILLLLLLFVCSCAGGNGNSSELTLISEFEGGKLYKAGSVSFLEFHGAHYQMGRQYGMLLKNDLAALYDLAVATFIDLGFTHNRLKQIADSIYAVYPQTYKDIIIGMAE